MFTLLFDNNSGKAKYHQLYEFIRDNIFSGKLKGGEKLPSKRNLASHLKISIVTVESAYQQLAAEGFIYSVPKSGFFVEKGLELNSYKRNPLSFQPEIYTSEPDKLIYDFSTGGVDTGCFPFSSWAKLMRTVLSDQQEKLLMRVDNKGAYELRLAISRHLQNFRGISVSPDNIIIGAGSEYLTSLIMLLLGYDKKYAVENPGYKRTYRLFERIAGETAAIAQDSLGISVNQLRLSGADIVHTTPSHHFPLGSVMPISRRRELLEWAYESDLHYIIEDEYDSEFRFTGSPIPSLFSLDSKGCVIYMNTFTKTIAPSIRISYMILPDNLMKRFTEELDFCSNTVPIFEQLTLAKFINEGYFERHINRIKKIYRDRRDKLISTLKNKLPHNSFSVEGENSGLHFLLRLNSSADEYEFVKAASDIGIRVHGLSEYYQCSEKYNGNPCVVIGYAQLNSNDIENAASLLADSWRKLGLV